jgi:hypothetical protein
LFSRVLTGIFASESHAKVEWKNGQWYGRVRAHERIAVLKDSVGITGQASFEKPNCERG